MSEICGMTTDLFPFNPVLDNPNSLGPCHLKTNHDGDHESAQSLEDKVVCIVNWRERSSGLEITGTVEQKLMVNCSSAQGSKVEGVPYKLSGYDLHFDKARDRRAALEQAVKMATARERMDSDFVLKVADKFFTWLQNKDL